MEISVFLARLLGLYLLLIGSAVLIRGEAMTALTREFFRDSALLWLGGVLALITGLIIVLLHSVWVLDWRLPITLIGYLGTLKGIMLLWLPDRMQNVFGTRWQRRSFTIIAILNMLLGVYFLHHGFLAHHLG